MGPCAVSRLLSVRPAEGIEIAISHTPHNSQSVVHFYWIGHPHYNGTSSSVQLLQYQFFAKS